MAMEEQYPGGDRLGTPERLGFGNTLAIVDNGAQYGFDIEQQAKRAGFHAVRVPFTTPIEELYQFGGIILSGGPQSVYSPDAPRPDPRLFAKREGRPPVLGICYGDQLINYAYHGRVERLDEAEYGYRKVLVEGDSPLLGNVTGEHVFIMSHGDTVAELAPGFTAIAYSGGMIAGIANEAERMYGVQFHPEVSPPAGPELLTNFFSSICGLENNLEYTTENFIEDAISEVRQLVGDRDVLAYLSGGVDSSGLAKLLVEALSPEQLHFVLVDNGFMRYGEIDKVVSMLANVGIDVHVIKAAERFGRATTTIDGKSTPELSIVVDPETKRKIIGDQFIEEQRVMARKLRLDSETYLLAMGTLYTDLIESGSQLASGGADTIKTHHNDTEEVRELRRQDRVIEPWRFLQKDDVRRVAQTLGLPEEICNRQPFPGPGLAIRVICGYEPYLDDANRLSHELSAFSTETISVHLAPIKSVGVQGDGRTYAHLALLSGEVNWQNLKQMANEIPSKVKDKGINRVAYVFGDKLDKTPSTITPTLLQSETVSLLRYADSLVNNTLEKYGLDRVISQVPVILLPIDFGVSGSRSIAIRTFMTQNYKTGDVAVPGVDFPEEILFEIVDELLTIPSISRVLYDLTSKPPATTEWE